MWNKEKKPYYMVRWSDDHFCFAGGFAGNVGHDPHILYTLSAVQVLALLDKLHVLDIDKVADCILFIAVCWSQIISIF